MDSHSALTSAFETAQRIRHLVEAPIPPEGRAIVPLTDYLEDDEWVKLWRVARAIQTDRPEVFNLYPENTVASFILEALTESSTPLSLDDLADAIRKEAETEGPWLISIPLANIDFEKPAIAIRPGVALQSANTSPDVMREADEQDADIRTEVFNHLDDVLPRPARWIYPSNGEPIDTRRSSAILLVEPGTASIAISRARAKARYALAAWVILRTPDGNEAFPELATISPQPFIQIGPQYKEKEEGKWAGYARARGGAIHLLDSFQAPVVGDLKIPFEAIEVVHGQRSAQALLSSSLSLFQASRGSRFLLSERVRSVQIAIETLCEASPGANRSSDRWKNVRAKHGSDTAFGRGYSDEQVASLSKRLVVARNVSTHGSDAALIDLGHPEGYERELSGKTKKLVSGEHLSLPGLTADLAPMISDVRHVLNSLWRLMSRENWNDDVFERQFNS